MELATTKQQKQAMEEQVRVLRYFNLGITILQHIVVRVLYPILVSKVAIISSGHIATDSSNIA